MIYFDRLQAGLRQAVLNTLASPVPVVWAPSEYPRDAADTFIALNLISGPDIREGRYHHVTAQQTLPTTIRVTCTNTSTARGIIDCAGAWWALDVGNPETAEAYRDRWVEALAATGYSIDAAITPVSTNAFDLTGSDPWSLYGFATRGEVTHSVTASTTSTINTTDVVMQVEIQCFSKSRYLREGAMALASRISSSLTLPSSYEVLDSRGLSLLYTQPIVDLTSLSGPDWESRAVLVLDIGMRSFVSEAVDTIEDLTGVLTAKDDNGELLTQTITQTLP